jgi:nucleoside-diphosphate-sugar epimerase
MMKDRVLFTTNGAGFIATSLIKRLIEHNEVIVYDNLSRNALKDSGLWGHPNLEVIQGDVLDFELLKENIPQEVDLVLHMAAIAGIDTGIKAPIKTLEVNSWHLYSTREKVQC